MKMTHEQAVRIVTINKVIKTLLEETTNIGLFFDDIPKAASVYYEHAKAEVDAEAKVYLNTWNDLEDRESGDNIIPLNKHRA